MLISTLGAPHIIAAANIETEIVFPKRRGVLISTSCARCSQPFTSSTLWWSRANCPAGSCFQKHRVHAFCVCRGVYGCYGSSHI